LVIHQDRENIGYLKAAKGSREPIYLEWEEQTCI